MQHPSFLLISRTQWFLERLGWLRVSQFVCKRKAGSKDVMCLLWVQNYLESQGVSLNLCTLVLA